MASSAVIVCCTTSSTDWRCLRRRLDSARWRPLSTDCRTWQTDRTQNSRSIYAFAALQFFYCRSESDYIIVIASDCVAMWACCCPAEQSSRPDAAATAAGEEESTSSPMQRRPTKSCSCSSRTHESVERASRGVANERMRMAISSAFGWSCRSLVLGDSSADVVRGIMRRVWSPMRRIQWNDYICRRHMIYTCDGFLTRRDDWPLVP